jgi:acetyl esterase/lipase
MTRRGVLAGLGASVLSACSSSYAPRPKVADGTKRVRDTYGTSPRQHGEWWVPDKVGLLRTVVLVHGGYWRSSYDLSLENAVAADLAGRGFLCWNIDYAPSAAPWPSTLHDVGAGYDHVVAGALAHRVDPERIAVVGHSAGGHLALWAASRSRLPVGAPGAGSRAPRPKLAVGQAPVAALADGAREGLGGGAVGALMGGSPDEVPERYAVADPLALLPTGSRTLLIHGTSDDVVPISQSKTYVDAAGAAGDPCRLETFTGGHFEHLDPKSSAVDLLRDALRSL